MSGLTKHIQEESFQKLKLLSGKSIGIRGWKMKEEKDFLFSIEANPDDKAFLIKECVRLGRNCVDNQELFDTLSRNDILFVLTNLRKLSKGGTIDFTYRCVNPKCPTYDEHNEQQRKDTGMSGMGRIPYEAKLDLEKDLITRPFDPSPFKIDKYTFHVKELTFTHQMEMEKEYFSDEAQSNIRKFQHYFMLESIKKLEVEGDDEVYEPPNIQELDDLIDTFSPGKAEEMGDKIVEKRSSFTIEKTVICPQCQFETEVLYEELFSIMVF